MATTPAPFALPYPTPADAPDVPYWLAALSTRLQEVLQDPSDAAAQAAAAAAAVEDAIAGYDAVLASYQPPDPPTYPDTAPVVSCLGDSLTEGYGGAGTTYPATLATIVPAAVVNSGTFGWTSTEVATRAGALDVFVTAAGNTIPASGAVSVTVLPAGDWRAGSSRSFTGTLAGIAGTLTKSAAEAWTFTRSTAGTATALPAETRWVSTAGPRPDAGRVIWAGHNNQTNAARVLADVTAMAADARRRRVPVAILSLVNAAAAGTPAYAEVAAINTELARDPAYYDLRGYLIRRGLADAGITATTADQTAIAEDRLPPSLMHTDGGHLNAAGYAVVGRRVAALTTDRGWYVPRPALAPLSVTGVHRRYSAAGTGQGTGEEVPVLTNIGGTAAGAMVALVGRAPRKRIGTTGPFLEFDNDYMECDVSDSTHGAGALTVYAVARFRGKPASGGASWVAVQAGSAGQGGILLNSAGNFSAFRSSTVATTTGLDREAWHVFVAVFAGASPASVLRVDDLELTGSAGTGSPGRLAVGPSLNGSQPFPGVDVAEFGSFTRALSSTERAALVTELRALYKL